MSLKAYGPNAQASTKPAILFVSATWCPHCRAAKPEMQGAAAILGSTVPVYLVDSEKNEAQIRRMKVDGFPTIFYRSPRGLKPYNGPRTARAVADWACAQAGSCSRRPRAREE